MNGAARVSVIGAGSWGTALALLLSDRGVDVSLWGHRADHVAALRRSRENSAYLPGHRLGERVALTEDIAEAVSGCPRVVMVVPSHVYREVFRRCVPHLSPGAMILSATKGIENDTLMTMTQVMADELGTEDGRGLGVLSGPSFAKEVAARVPTAVTVASRSRETALAFQDLFSTDFFRVYTSTDVIGVELGGPLKNVVAIAAGICDGLGFGTNTRAALITRGLAEITRMGVRMGANPLTFSGLAGLGDLVLTCTGDLSRNRRVGILLGQGRTLSSILQEMNMVAEGVKTARSALRLAQRHGVEMPILEQVHQVLYEDKPCAEAVRALLTRGPKDELES